MAYGRAGPSADSSSDEGEREGNSYMYVGNTDDTHFDAKIKRNKDGRPRKRSHHSKGHKLWEFIRDALKDPTTCPSVVR